jgi:hypothetical protein
MIPSTQIDLPINLGCFSHVLQLFSPNRDIMTELMTARIHPTIRNINPELR